MISLAQAQGFENQSIAQTLAPSLAPSSAPSSAPIVRGDSTLALGFLVFGVIVIFLIVYFNAKTSERGNDSIRLIGITIIVVSAIFVVIAGIGLGESIITAVIGLLGTLGGYLAGTQSQGTKEPEPKS